MYVCGCVRGVVCVCVRCVRCVCVCVCVRMGVLLLSQSQTWSWGSTDEIPPRSQRTQYPDPHRSQASADLSQPVAGGEGNVLPQLYCLNLGSYAQQNWSI